MQSSQKTSTMYIIKYFFIKTYICVIVSKNTIYINTTL